MMYQINHFENTAILDEQLAKQVAMLLQQAVDSKGKASLALSGGSTPKGFLELLSCQKISWENITVTLVDERWLDVKDTQSNTNLLHKYLFKNFASAASFFPLKIADNFDDTVIATLSERLKSILPFDVAILGMGTDGHTASLFPCSKQIEQGLKNSSIELLKIEPSTAPYQRISFSFSALARSQSLFLHITGAEKKQVLEQAISGQNSMLMPIRAFLHAKDINTQVYWAE